jgi:hypothetical protein
MAISPAAMEAKPGLEPLLARALAEGRAAWPGLDVPEAAFRKALIAAIEARVESIEGAGLQGVHTADLYLACGCVLALPAATRAFVSQHLAAVPGYLVHLDPSAWLAEEVTQELAEKLLVARPPTFPGSPAMAGGARCKTGSRSPPSAPPSPCCAGGTPSQPRTSTATCLSSAPCR